MMGYTFHGHVFLMIMIFVLEIRLKTIGDLYFVVVDHDFVSRSVTSPTE